MAEKKELVTDKYAGKGIRFYDRSDHYELVFMDDFTGPHENNSVLTDIMVDMRAADKHKELHVLISSYGGEVAALNTVLQQILEFDHRVGVNLGTACSCGWILLFACQERYVAPFSQLLYHSIWSISMGKADEIHNTADFLQRWQEQLLKVTDTAKFLTKAEIKLGETSEVWFTGQELIDRGAARPYYLYETRPMLPKTNVVQLGDELWLRDGQYWYKHVETEDKPLTYQELFALFATPKAEVKKAAKKPAPVRKVKK